MNILKGTLALTGGDVWIWCQHIVRITVNAEGGAVICTIDGKQTALKESPSEVLHTIDRLVRE